MLRNNNLGLVCCAAWTRDAMNTAFQPPSLRAEPADPPNPRDVTAVVSVGTDETEERNN